MTYSAVKTSVIVAMIVLHITMNYLLIAVLVKYAELREDRTVLFKISLSLADAVDLRSGLTVLPIGAVFCSRVISRVQHLTQYLPKINMVCLSIFGFASMQSQAWVAFSKMVSVSKQLRYELSRNRCHGIIVSTWIFGAAVAVEYAAVVEYRRLLVYIRGTQQKRFCVGVSVVPSLVSLSGTCSHLRDCANNVPRCRPSSHTSLGVGAVDQRRRRRFRNGES